LQADPFSHRSADLRSTEITTANLGTQRSNTTTLASTRLSGLAPLTGGGGTWPARAHGTIKHRAVSHDNRNETDPLIIALKARQASMPSQPGPPMQPAVPRPRGPIRRQKGRAATALRSASLPPSCGLMISLLPFWDMCRDILAKCDRSPAEAESAVPGRAKCLLLLWRMSDACKATDERVDVEKRYGALAGSA